MVDKPRRKPLIAVAAEEDGEGIGRYPYASNSRCFGQQSRSFHFGGGRARQSAPHRRAAQLRPAGGAGLTAPHHVPQRPEGIARGVAAACPPRRVAAQTVVARDVSGGRQPRPFGLLPRRVHVPVQSADLPAPREAVLPASGASRGGRTRALHFARQACELGPAASTPPASPQLMVAT